MHESLRSSPDSSQSSIEAPGFKYSHYPFPFPSNKMEPWLPPSSLALSMSHADSWGCVTVPLMAFLVLTSQSSDSLISNDLHLYFTSAVHTHATPNRSVPLSAFQTPLASFGSRLLLQPLFLYFSRSFFLPLSFPGLPLFPVWKDEGGMRLASPFIDIPAFHSGYAHPIYRFAHCSLGFSKLGSFSAVLLLPLWSQPSIVRKLHKN